jgi:quercetin dioxygenase-like cupin family protein
MAMEQSPLPRSKRYITTHNSEGKAIFSNKVSPDVKWGNIGKAQFFLGYATKKFPSKLDDEEDITIYDDLVQNPPGIVITTGTVLRVVDMRPGHVSPMHRTVSLDYAVCLEGEVEMIVDSGESRILRRGDLGIQRATNHQWRNRSDTEWARMLYVLTPVEPITVGGKTLGEDYGDMQGVAKST